MMISGLSIRITAPIVLISALAIGLTAFLNFGKFERTFSDLERSRLQFLIGDLRANIETGLNLGLALKGLANAQAAIDFEARKDPGILSISLYDETGLVVFHTGQALGSSAIPAAWKLASSARTGRNWQATEADAFVVGTGLSSVVGLDAGGVALRYSRQAHGKVVDSVSRELGLAAAAGIGITAVIAIFGISVLVVRNNRKLSRIEQALRQLSGEAAPPGDKADEPGVAALINGVIQSSRNAMADMEAAQQVLQTELPTGRKGDMI